MKKLIVFTDGFHALMSNLETILRFSFDRSEIDRAFAESRRAPDGTVDASEKRYEFCLDPSSPVRGLVEEHEPESIWIEFSMGKALRASIEQLFEAYELAFGSGAAFRTFDESLDIFNRSAPDGD